MKVLPVVILAGVVGIAGGGCLAVWRVKSLPWDGTSEGAKGRPILADGANADVPPKRIKGPDPEVVIEETNYDFGVMDSASVGKHDFVFKNVG